MSVQAAVASADQLPAPGTPVQLALNEPAENNRQIRQKKLNKFVPHFASLPAVELRRNAEKCTLIPPVWVFVASGNTFADYQQALAEISADDANTIFQSLHLVNPNLQSDSLDFFSYVSVPKEYSGYFQRRFEKQINEHNGRSGCETAIRPARVFVVPQEMSMHRLLYQLGSRQKESVDLLSSQIVQLNPAIDPNEQISKGELILLPQSYPYSALANEVAQGSSEPVAPQSDETLTQALRSEFIVPDRGFWWSAGYSLASARVIGQDTASGGSFELVSATATRGELDLGAEFGFDTGVFAIAASYAQEDISYLEDQDTDIYSAEIRSDYYALQMSYRFADLSFGYGAGISSTEFKDIERESTTSGTVVTDSSNVWSLFTLFNPGIEIFGFNLDATLGVNSAIGSSELTGRVAVDGEIRAKIALDEDYDLQFKVGVRNYNYEKKDRSFEDSQVYTGVNFFVF